MNINLLPKSPIAKNSSPSLRATFGVFIFAFAVLTLILNGPTILAAVKYPLRHSPESDNELLTKQYESLYGYVRHPEIQNIGAVRGQGILSVPKLDIAAPIVGTASADSNDILSALKQGVVLYPGSSELGTAGTSVVVGHSSSDLPWTKYSSIFSTLNKLANDDIVYVTIQDRQYAYRVTGVRKGSVEDLAASGLRSNLILSSCWPIGTDEQRIVVTADLIASN